MLRKTLDEYLKQTIRTTTKPRATKPRYRIAGFYKETQFQETPIGKIPKEWSITKLRNVAKINESKINISNLKEEVARIPMELIPDNGIYAKYVLMSISEIRSYVTARAGDILLAKITPSFENGKQGIVPDDVPHGIALVTTEVYPITSINIEKLFLFYLLKWRRYRKLLEGRMTGTTGRRRVPKDALENLLIPLPPLEEQWGIAEVLSSVDEAIEATERLIERLERLKRALMQELLTKGIGHKEYKQTTIGKIPKQWEVVKLEDVTRIIKTGPFGSQLRRKELTGRGIKVYTQKNVIKRNFSIGSLYISEEKFEQLKSFEVQPNDVLLTIRGTVGKAVVVPYNIERGIIHTNLAIIRVDNSKLIPHYLELIINESNIIARQIEASRSSTTLSALYAGTIKRLKIPLPPLKEQKMIIDIISSVNRWIELEKRRKEKFERLKRGLMELLLTGRIRVRVERVGEAGASLGSAGVSGH